MAKNQQAQQATERRHVEAFLAMLGESAGVIEYGDKPDAVIVLDGRRIGLEHCELEDERLARNRGSFIELERGLNDGLSRMGVDPEVCVGVSVDAWAAFFSDRKAIRLLADQLAALAKKCAPHVTSDLSIELRARDLFREHAVGPSLVTISRHTPPLLEGFRACVSPGFCGPGESTAVRAVRKKEERIAVYAANGTLSEVWLLLVTGDRWTQATDSLMTEYTRISTQYDRVYLLDLRTGFLQRLDPH